MNSYKTMYRAVRNVVMILFIIMVSAVLGRVSAQDKVPAVNTLFTISPAP